MKYCTSSLQQGFAAIAALVLIAVLATMGGYLVTTSDALQATSAKDVQGIRAYWAARAGLEWGLARIATTTPAACPAINPQILVINTDVVINQNLAIGQDYNVTVNCVLNAYPEAGGVVRNIFQITSTATLGTAPGQAGYVERSVFGVFASQ